MSVFLLLIPISLGLAVGFVLLCLASIRGGQFDDLESPRWRMLFDEAPRNGAQSGTDTRPQGNTLAQGITLPRKNHETHPV